MLREKGIATWLCANNRCRQQNSYQGVGSSAASVLEAAWARSLASALLVAIDERWSVDRIIVLHLHLHRPSSPTLPPTLASPSPPSHPGPV